MKEIVKINGKEFEIRTLSLTEWREKIGDSVFPEEEIRVADIALWDELENEIYVKNNQECVELDNSIIFYCENGYLATNPTDEELVNYLIENNLFY